MGKFFRGYGTGLFYTAPLSLAREFRAAFLPIFPEEQVDIPNTLETPWTLLLKNAENAVFSDRQTGIFNCERLHFLRP